MPKAQVPLFEVFQTTRPGNPLYCHQEFLEKLTDAGSSQVGKRAALLLHRLLVDESRQYYKPTRGVNRGWRRSRLGGRGGSHYYAWWAPKGAPPFKGQADFAGAPPHAIFLRDIRHHDNHDELKPDSFSGDYLPVSARELRNEEYTASPWTAAQKQFTEARQYVRVLKGYPGSGKTTALWNAADAASTRSALYVTYSPELAALARDHFEKFCSSEKKFLVITFSRLLRQLLRSEEPVVPERESRAAFVRETGGLPPRTLGPWADNRGALYDEMHAHLIGSALPIAAGRFAGGSVPRLDDSHYRTRRAANIGRAAADGLLDVAQTLWRRNDGQVVEKFFPELWRAWRAAKDLLEHRNEGLARYGLPEVDCVAVDEVQDLTPLESLVLMLLGAGARQSRKSVEFLAAGDEAQTVRPTDFEWGWFHDLLHHQLASPAEYHLPANVRSPRRIAELVNLVWDLYSYLDKHDRPSGQGLADIDEDAGDQVLYCSATPSAELERLLHALSEREGLALICLGERIPEYVPEPLRNRVLTAAEAKGLDFHSVCVLDPGKHLAHVLGNGASEDRFRRDATVMQLTRRLAIDQLRVAISRPAERLYWLDVSARPETVRLSLKFLNSTPTPIAVSAAVPEAILKTLEEELLDPEERIRLCEQDALQYLGVRPEIAWSRARQAITLLGGVTGDSIDDTTVRQSAYTTAARVSFCCGYRKLAMPVELGQPDFFRDAAQYARAAGKRGLAKVIEQVDHILFASTPAMAQMEKGAAAGLSRSLAIMDFARAVDQAGEELDSWLSQELADRSTAWLADLEGAARSAAHAEEVLPLLPAVYRMFNVPNAGKQMEQLRQGAVDELLRVGLYRTVLNILPQLESPRPDVEARCLEGLGKHADAAERYLALGRPKEALRSLRAIPDLDRAIEVLRELPDSAATDSLLWMKKMKELIEQRPENFPRVVTEAEKKLLQEMLEASFGVSRKKKTPAARKPGRPRTRMAKQPD